MLALSLPRLLVSDERGWTELLAAPPTVSRTLLTRVLPFAVIPPLMCMYSVTHYPGAVLPAIAPAFQMLAMTLLGAAAVALEVAIVAVMAGQLRLLADAPDTAFDEGLGLRASLAFAAVVPVPLWLSALALFAPSKALLVAAILAGWAGSAALVRQGVAQLYRPRTTARARQLTREVLSRGVFGWLMIVAALVLPWYALAALAQP